MDLKDQLIEDEGLRLFPYTDTTGNITIGVGRNLTKDGISEDEAMILLEDDIEKFTSRVTNRWPWVSDLSEPRQAVLINMAFNMGIGGLETFVHFLGYVKAGRWLQASRAMLDSLWAKQVGERAVRLSEQMKTGEWES